MNRPQSPFKTCARFGHVIAHTPSNFVLSNRLFNTQKGDKA